ncbi:hypothetical protein CPB83DRAFT_899938, partial [Crepidotus variabilis]
MVQFVNVVIVAALAATPILAIPINAREPVDPKHAHIHHEQAHDHHHHSHIKAREPGVPAIAEGKRNIRQPIRPREPVDPGYAPVHHEHVHDHHHHPHIHAREPRVKRISVARAAGHLLGGATSQYGREFEDDLEARSSSAPVKGGAKPPVYAAVPKRPR